MKTSEKLKEVLSFLDSCESSLMYYQNEVETENKRLQDFIHYIELEPSAKLRSKKSLARDLSSIISKHLDVQLKPEKKNSPLIIG